MKTVKYAIALALICAGASLAARPRERHGATYATASTGAADSGGDAGPDTGVPYDSGIESVDDQFAAVGAYQWPANPSACAPDASLSSRDGGPYIPLHPVDATVGCSASTEYAAGQEVVGNRTGITKLNTLNDALDFTAGRGQYLSTSATGFSAIADGANFGVCTLFRPTSTGGTKTMFQWQTSASEYFRWRFTNAMQFRIRESGAGSANIDVAQIPVVYMSNNEWHFSCGLYQGVAEGGTNPRVGMCMDGWCSYAAEMALNLQGFGAPAANGISISGETSGINLMLGDIARVWFLPPAAHDALFGTTAAEAESRFRQLSIDLGITTHRTAILAVGAGQSNMQGCPNAAESTTQSHTNFEGLGGTDISLLVEGTGTSACESMGVALGDALKSTYGRGEDLLWVERAVGGSAISSWAPGQSNYNTLIDTWVTNAVTFARGKWPSLRAFVFWDQGEQDVNLACNTAGWATSLAAIQEGMDSDIRALTGVEDLEVVMFMDQTSNFTAYDCASSDIVTTEQYAAGITDYPGRIRMCQPKYQYTHLVDGIHLDADGQQAKGRVNARCLDWYLRTGDWKPVHIDSTARVDNVVTAQVWTPVPPLVGSCSGTAVSDPGNGGWEWSDTGSSRTISSVSYGSCSGHLCPVTITLSGTPSGTMRLRYAYSGTSGNNGGPTTGARGCVHDSASADANWLVHSNVAVN